MPGVGEQSQGAGEETSDHFDYQERGSEDEDYRQSTPVRLPVTVRMISVRVRVGQKLFLNPIADGYYGKGLFKSTRPHGLSFRSSSLRELFEFDLDALFIAPATADDGEGDVVAGPVIAQGREQIAGVRDPGGAEGGYHVP